MTLHALHIRRVGQQGIAPWHSRLNPTAGMRKHRIFITDGPVDPSLAKYRSPLEAE